MGYFSSEFDEQLSEFRARELVDFMLKQIGPSQYNQAIQDARKYMAGKLDDLDTEFFEPERSSRPNNHHLNTMLPESRLFLHQVCARITPTTPKMKGNRGAWGMSGFYELPDLEKWLESKPRQVSGLIAARAALRAFPMINKLPIITSEQAKSIILPICRSLAMPWATVATEDSSLNANFGRHGTYLATSVATNEAYYASPDIRFDPEESFAAEMAFIDSINFEEDDDTFACTHMGRAALSATETIYDDSYVEEAIHAISTAPTRRTPRPIMARQNLQPMRMPNLLTTRY